MIFLGDTAHPFSSKPSWPLPAWIKQPVVLNLEGAFIKSGELTYINKGVLFNHSSILGCFKDYNVKAVSLANNHSCDIDGGLLKTINILEEEDIHSIGAGSYGNADDEKVITFEDNCYILIAVGWETIQCPKVTKNRMGVAPFNSKKLLKKVSELKETYPTSVIIVNIHWNYELERYPQPAHRELAFNLIDMGVDAIIGHHPHIVGGIEIYKGKPIVYSLGNWWLPQNVFFKGKIKYPIESYKQLAFEFSLSGAHVCHWYNYNPDKHTLKYDKSEELKQSIYSAELTPFRGMSHETYIAWFKRHRIKSKLLPIYKYHNHVFSNTLKDNFVYIRHPLMKMFKKIQTVWR